MGKFQYGKSRYGKCQYDQWAMGKVGLRVVPNHSIPIKSDHNIQLNFISYVPSLQSEPCQPGAQLQVKDPSLLLHVAPLTQSPTPSFVKHSFMSVKNGKLLISVILLLF